jgi:hypothetical protein
MATIRNTSKEYRKELRRISMEKFALENQIRARATDLIKRFPYVIIVENYMGSEGNLLAKNCQELDQYNINRIVDFIEIIEADIASKHPYKQTEIEFPKTQHEKIMDIAKGIQAVNIPKSKK